MAIIALIEQATQSAGQPGEGVGQGRGGGLAGAWDVEADDGACGRKVIDERLQQFQTRPDAVAQDHRSAVVAGAGCDPYSIAAEGHPLDVFSCGHR